MTDRMRVLELCMKECAAAFDWSISGNYLVCSRGSLSFTLLPVLDESGIVFTLFYRLTVFDRLYHQLTGATVYPGVEISTQSQPVETWSLMGLSAAMRLLTGRASKMVQSLALKITSPEENLTFLRFLTNYNQERSLPRVDFSYEMIMTGLLLGDYMHALNVARTAVDRGDIPMSFYSRVNEYVHRYHHSESR